MKEIEFQNFSEIHQNLLLQKIIYSNNVNIIFVSSTKKSSFEIQESLSYMRFRLIFCETSFIKM